MPVIDGLFVPRSPLVLAEQTVDFPAINSHILEQRILVEEQARSSARRVAATAVEFQLGGPSVMALEQTLAQSLRRTVRFGYRTAQTELRQLRAEPVAGATRVEDAGSYSRAAREGLEGVQRLVARRAREAADAVSRAALAAAGTALLNEEDDVTRLATVLAATVRTLHNRVLDLVGESLNLGRAAGALGLTAPPTFAMRSEQLDKATCDQCTRLHGEIVEVDSPSYYDLMPPAGCQGGGRCRGLYVFADGVSQVRGPDTEPGPQPALPAIPPVRIPVRPAA